MNLNPSISFLDGQTLSAYNSTALNKNKSFYANFLEPGSTIGEIEILYQLKFDSDIIALKDCHLVVIPAGEYRRICENYEVKRVFNYIQYFFKVPFLCNWQLDQIMLLRSKLYTVRYRSMETVFREGDAINFVYFIKDGKFVVSHRALLPPQKHLAHHTNYGEGRGGFLVELSHRQQLAHAPPSEC